MRFRGVIVLVAVWAGCYEPPQQCGITCTTSCPGDLACVDGVCTPTDGTECPVTEIDFAAIAVGGRHVCGLAVDGALFCWGDNRRGQLGVGSTQDTVPRPTRVTGTWTAVASGSRHTCALRDGTPWCWGDNEINRVGAATNATFTSPVEVEFGPALRPAFDRLDVGIDHSCALGAGQLWCWGRTDRLGNGNVGAPVATRIGALEDWTAVSTGDTHSCGLSASTGLLCWGLNDRGQATSPSSTLIDSPTPMTGLPMGLQPIAVEAGSRLSCAIMGPAGGTAGELWCWGTSYLIDGTFSSVAFPPTRIGNADGWTAISLQENLACGILGGRGFCWGTGRYGGAGSGLWDDPRRHDEAFDLGPTDEIDVGRYEYEVVGDYTGCMRNAGVVRCWGGNTFGTLGLGMTSWYLAPVETPAPDGHTWASVDGGQYHVCATTDDGALWCWGSDTQGQITARPHGKITPCTIDECDAPTPTPVPAGVGRPDDVVAGTDYTCVREGGAARCWGTNGWSEVGGPASGSLGVTTVAGAAGPFVKLIGGSRATCGVLASGQVACWGQINNSARATPAVVMQAEVRDVVDIGFGVGFACAVRTDGARVCWGSNNRGQLGDGGTAANPNAVAFTSPALRAISADDDRACAVTMAGGIVCWGQNGSGEGGVDGVDPLLTPAAVADTSDAPLTACVDVSIAADHSCAICGGAPVCWGQGSWGGLGLGLPITRNFASHAAQAVAVPPGLTFVAVTTIEDGGCALTDGGRLFCWGLSVHGEVGAGGHGVNLPTPIGPAL